MNEDIERLEKLLQSGDYGSLDLKDKKWIENTLGGEAGFAHLQSMTVHARAEKEVRVSPTVKQDLMKQFRQKHQPTWKTAIQWKVPAYAAALVMVLFTSVVVMLMPTKERIVEKVIAQDPVIDTVYVASAPDTVFVERTIDRPVYVTVYRDQPTETSPVLAEVKKPKGKSLADQADITDILVSGR